LTFYTGGGGTTLGSEAVRIDASGNVGIAKNPSSGYKLDVNGVVRVSGTTASNARIQTVSTNTNETASIDFAVTTSDSTVTAQIEALRTNVATAADTDLLFKVFRNSTLTERMRILSDGHITYDGCFAGIHVHDASTAQSIANGATYVKLTAFTDNDGSSNCTADAANDKITITKTGYYRVEGSFSFSSGTANVEWFGSLFAGGVEINSVHWTRKVGTAGDVGNAGFTGIIDITTANTDVDIRLRHDNAGSVDITVSYANLNVTYVGET